MWWAAAQKTGVSASNFKDFMGFGSYRTAWTWLHKPRRAMVRQNRGKLKGGIEVDETFVGGRESGKKGNGTGRTGKIGRGGEEKTLVVVAVECPGKRIGRVRFKCIDAANGENLVGFIRENVDKGSTIVTDGRQGYSELADPKDHQHVKRPIAGSGQQAHELLPHVHRVDSLLKRWTNGTHQGTISPKYLGFYLDEYALRFNRKLSTHRGKLFYRLVQQSVRTRPRPLKSLKTEKVDQHVYSR